jgi:hypothetical protein
LSSLTTLAAFVVLALFGSAAKKGAVTDASSLLQLNTYRRIASHETIESEITVDVDLARHVKYHRARTKYPEYLHLPRSVIVRLFAGFPGFFACVKRSGLYYLRKVPTSLCFTCALALMLPGLITAAAPFLQRKTLPVVVLTSSHSPHRLGNLQPPLPAGCKVG